MPGPRKIYDDAEFAAALRALRPAARPDYPGLLREVDKLITWARDGQNTTFARTRRRIGALMDWVAGRADDPTHLWTPKKLTDSTVADWFPSVRTGRTEGSSLPRDETLMTYLLACGVPELQWVDWLVALRDVTANRRRRRLETTQSSHSHSSPTAAVRVGALPLLADCHQQRREARELAEHLLHPGGTVVLVGLGGVGKSQLATSYARMAAPSMYVLLWIHATTRSAILDAYRDAAVMLGWMNHDDTERAAEYFLNWCQSSTQDWLVVLDDVRDITAVRGLWPEGRTGRTILTTRRVDLAFRTHGRRTIPVREFGPAESLTYLDAKLVSLRPSPDTLELKALAADLGYLPLALAQAAAYILNNLGETCASYRDRLADRRHALTDLFPVHAAADDYDSTIAATWSISIDAADHLSQPGLARSLLQDSSVFAPHGFPAELITNAPDEATSRSRLDSLRDLHRFSLLTLVRDDSTHVLRVRIHALVQRAALAPLPDDDLAAVVRRGADRLVRYWGSADRERRARGESRANASSLVERYFDQLWTPDPHPILWMLGRSLADNGSLAAALTYWRRFADAAAEHRGRDHADTYLGECQVADLMGECGDPGSAAQAFRLLVDRSGATPDPADLRTAASMHDQARWQGQAGDTRGAAKTFARLVSQFDNALGSEHPFTISARRNLARWSGEAGRPNTAVRLFEEILDRRQRNLDSVDVLQLRHELTHWRGEYGLDSTVLHDFRAIADERRDVLGPYHPHTLRSRHKLAYWRAEFGDVTGALQAFTHLVNDLVRALGHDHPQTLGARHALYDCQGLAGNPAAASDAYQKLLVDCRTVLAANHPHTLASWHNAAHWLACTGRRAEAVAELQQLARICEPTLGRTAPETMRVRRSATYWAGADPVDPAGAARGALFDRSLRSRHNFAAGGVAVSMTAWWRVLDAGTDSTLRPESGSEGMSNG